MAEGAGLVWIRGPGFGCKAVRCASARCTVRDFIHRHCQDQVRISVPVRKEKEADRWQRWVRSRSVRRRRGGYLYSLGFSLVEAESSSVLRCFELLLRASFSFVMVVCLPTKREKKTVRGT